MERQLSAPDDRIPSHTVPPNRAAASQDGTSLEVTIANGAPFTLRADCLRMACRCAHCRRAQIDGVFAPDVTAIAIVSVASIGHYAVNLEFSDGHARGIYPWTYLEALSGAERPF